jgi:hypothetical protein
MDARCDMNPHVEYRTCSRLSPDRHLVGKDGSVWFRESIESRWKRLKVRMNKYRSGDGFVAAINTRIEKGGRLRVFTVGHLVLSAFGRPKPLGCYCWHENGDPLDNRLSNLRWRDKSFIPGNPATLNRGNPATLNRGNPRDHPGLSAEKVVLARELYKAGSTFRDIAEHLNLDPKTVYRFVVGITWGHIPGAVQSRPRGSWATRAKLDEIDVLEIRQLLGGGVSMAEISRRKGIHRMTVARIRDGKTWAHVTDGRTGGEGEGQR